MYVFEPDRVAAAVRGLADPGLPPADLRAAVTDALTRPQPHDMSRGRRVLPAVLAAQYAELFERLELPRQLHLYEPCVGASDPVIVAADSYSDGRAHYTGVNLNRKLRDELRVKVAGLQSTIRIIDDDAQRVRQDLDPGSVHVACFHHAVNDLLQTAVAEPRGLDTATIDWWPKERQMIDWLAEEHAAHGLETRGRPELLQVVADAVELVGPGGWLIFDHWTWLGHRELEGFPFALFGDLLPMTRRWIAEHDLPVAEHTFDGADPRWWMVLRVEA